MLGLGGSVATPKKGITAQVIPVASFEELEKRGRAEVEGKIVLFNAPWEGAVARRCNTRRVPSRRRGISGAVAALVRPLHQSACERHIRVRAEYDPDAPKIPATAVTIEDAILMARLAVRATRWWSISKWKRTCYPMRDSANVIGEIPGSEKPGKSW